MSRGLKAGRANKVRGDKDSPQRKENYVSTVYFWKCWSRKIL